jgi:hypothetical protein
MGEPDSLIVVATPELWAQLEQDTYDILEAPFPSIRDEKKFFVTHVAPGDPQLDKLLLWKQVVVFAPPGDRLVGQIVDAAGRTEAELSPPEIVQANDVWASGQLATAVVLDPEDEIGSARAELPSLQEQLDRQFRAYALSRMFVSGMDSVFADSLATRLGFTMNVPKVYRHAFRDSGIVLMRNDNPDPSELIRSILVQRLPARDSVTVEQLVAWRTGIDSVQYNVPQAFQLADEAPQRFRLGDADVLQVRGSWNDEGSYPAGGALILRAVLCPESAYFLDAWLYSPNPRRSKYEYLLQLGEILDSFRCVTP